MNPISQIEKTPIQSKKFLAYLLSNLGSKILIFRMIEKSEDNIVLIALITASSFIDIGYILGQAALDKYVRIASLAKE